MVRRTTTPGNNLFSRTLISGGTVTVLTGQGLRVVYTLTITVPSTTTPGSYAITGWPVAPSSVVTGTTPSEIRLGQPTSRPLGAWERTEARTPITFAPTRWNRRVIGLSSPLSRPERRCPLSAATTAKERPRPQIQGPRKATSLGASSATTVFTSVSVAPCVRTGAGSRSEWRRRSSSSSSTKTKPKTTSTLSISI
jgi:hypothetical protein